MDGDGCVACGEFCLERGRLVTVGSFAEVVFSRPVFVGWVPFVLCGWFLVLWGREECLFGGVPVFEGDFPVICTLLSLQRVRLVCIPFPLFLRCETPLAGSPRQDLLSLFPWVWCGLGG